MTTQQEQTTTEEELKKIFNKSYLSVFDDCLKCGKESKLNKGLCFNCWKEEQTKEKRCLNCNCLIGIKGLTITEEQVKQLKPTRFNSLYCKDCEGLK